MPERRERSPLSREVAAHLQNVANRGLVVVTDRRHGAIHGTSLETIDAMRSSGVIIGYSHKKPRNNTRFGDLYVFPTRKIANEISHLTDQSIRQQIENAPQEAIERTLGYAKSAAQKHAFLTALGLPLTDATAIDYADELTFSYEFDQEMFARARSYFRRRKFSGEAIDAALEEALLRRGFLLGISPEITSIPGITLHNGDYNASDIRVSTDGKGFPYQLISGIQPLCSIDE
jgi:hypothetical protein